MSIVAIQVAFFGPHSSQAVRLENCSIFIYIVCMFILMLITGLVSYAPIRFRRRTCQPRPIPGYGLLIAVPTGVKIFNRTATMLSEANRFATSMCFSIVFLITFTIGELTFRPKWQVSTLNRYPIWRLCP